MINKDYKFLINISRNNIGEWERLLNSNQGLFQKRGTAPNRIIGPQIDRSGRIIGDLMAYEIMYFRSVATPEQNRFFDFLESANPQAAKEYVLTITNSLRRWKEDIKWLRVALKYLEKKEHLLEKEEILIKKDEELNDFSTQIPPVLKRHFPQLFENKSLEDLDFNNLLKKIEITLKRTEYEESYLKKYIKEKEKEMPFLFR